MPEDQISGSADAGDVAKEADSLASNMKRGAPMRHELLFRAHVRAGSAVAATPEQIADIENRLGYFRTRRRMPNALPVTKMPIQLFHIEYTVFDPQLKALSEQNGLPASLEFAAVAYDAQGQILNGMLEDGQLPAKPRRAADPARAKNFLTSSRSWKCRQVRSRSGWRCGIDRPTASGRWR